MWKARFKCRLQRLFRESTRKLEDPGKQNLAPASGLPPSLPRNSSYLQGEGSLVYISGCPSPRVQTSSPPSQNNYSLATLQA